MKVKYRLFLSVIILLLVGENQCNAQHDSVKVRNLLDSVRVLDNFPNQRTEYVSQINHGFLEIYSPILYPIIKKEFERVHEIENLKTQFNLSHLMEATYYTFGNYDKASEIAYELLKIAEKTDDSIHFYFAYSSIGADEEALGYDDINFLLIAHKYAAFDNGLLSKAKIELGDAYLHKQMYDVALNYIEDGIQLAIQEKNNVQLPYAYISMIGYLIEIEKYDKALTYCDKVDSIIISMGDNQDSKDALEIATLSGIIYTELGNYSQATTAYEKAYYIADKANDIHLQSNICVELSTLEEYKGNNAKSLSYHKEYTNLKDKIFTQEASNQVQALKVIYQVEKNDLKLKTIEKEVEFSKKRTWYIIIIASICILALVAVVMFFKIRSDAEKTQKALIHQKNKNNEIEIENLELELQLKDKKLADVFLQQYEKAKLLTTLIEDVEESNEKLKHTLNEQLNQNKDWDNFKFHFDKVHEGFFKKLNHLSSDLTPKDIRFCAYVRMNLQSKEIAMMLGISHRTVQGIRGRVRKKLELDSKDDLTLFLMKL